MPIEPGDRTRAQELGQRSGQARQARQPLTLERVETELPPMDSPEHVRQGLQMIQRWAVAGLLSGTVASAAVRAGEVWLKLWETAIDVGRLQQLERRIKELERELADARRGRASSS